MSRETDFLLASVRRYFQLRSPLPSTENLNWPEVVKLAETHAVVALFYEGVRTSTDTPREVISGLQQQTLQAARFDLTLHGELARLLALFQQEHIETITLKGPLLRDMLYGDQAMRSSTDLDLLVHRPDVLRAKRLLEDRGYHLDSVLHWQTENACLRYRDSQISLSRRTDGARVDLHWRLLPDYFPKSFDDLEVWSNLRKMPLAGTTASTLPPERLILFLCAHGMKHLWERLAWVCDVARLVQVGQPDWNVVFAQAEQTDTSRMVLLGLLLTWELLGVDLPAGVNSRIDADPKVRILAGMITSRLLTGRMTRPAAMEAALYSRHGFQRASHRARFVFGIFFEPSEAEYMVLRLPPFLHWLYYLVRPLRLAAKYAARYSS